MTTLRAMNQFNKTKVGLWIDFKKAIVIRLQDYSASIKYIESQIDSLKRSTGGVASPQPWWKRSSATNKHTKNKIEAQIYNFFEEVYLEIENNEVGELFIFGPAEAKLRFKNYLEREGFPVNFQITELQAAGSRLTIGQIVELVKERFGQKPPRYTPMTPRLERA